jgi:hypothetical protein
MGRLSSQRIEAAQAICIAHGMWSAVGCALTLLE